MKIVVYSCITNNYELPKNNQFWGGYDWFFFADNVNSETSGRWKLNYITPDNPDPRRVARKIKILAPFDYLPSDYDWYVWIDGTISIKEDIKKLIDNFVEVDTEMLVLAHPERQTIREELEICRKLKLSNKEILDRHENEIQWYLNNETLRLVETKVLFRRSSPQVEEFSRQWYNMLNNFSVRDQLSFTPILSKYTDLKWKYLPGINKLKGFFEQVKHKRTIY